ncbi:Nitric oxide synthase, brain [Saguinus oedipus]|uniref:nitric-oxide synthase (NADPH) n=1 Tax=Saguinus oedipus TaxID=9490 RepID=A0ABQ9V015_SAGOE|nr:Nitric oxide synthase, brain [Saguinus oedipus]
MERRKLVVAVKALVPYDVNIEKANNSLISNDRSWKRNKFRLTYVAEAPELTQGLSNVHKKRVSAARLLSRQNLQSPKSSRSTIFVRLHTNGNQELQYQPGDHLGVFPGNHEDLVNALIERLEDAPPVNQMVKVELLEERNTALVSILEIHIEELSKANGSQCFISGAQEQTRTPNLDSSPHTPAPHPPCTSTGVISNWTDECRLPPCTIFQAFKYYLDITTPPTPLQLQQFASLATSEKEKQRLLVLSKLGFAINMSPNMVLHTPQHDFPGLPLTVANVTQALQRRISRLCNQQITGLHWMPATSPGLQEYEEWKWGKNPTIVEVLEEFPSIQMPATLLLTQLSLLQPRYYSISSSPDMYPDEVHLTVAIVSYRTRGGQSYWESHLLCVYPQGPVEGSLNHCLQAKSQIPGKRLTHKTRKPGEETADKAIKMHSARYSSKSQDASKPPKAPFNRERCESDPPLPNRTLASCTGTKSPQLCDFLFPFRRRDPGEEFQRMNLALGLGAFCIGGRERGSCAWEQWVTLTALVILLDGEGPIHHGVCSSWLNRIQADEVVPCFVRGAPSFHLPRNPQVPCILVGPGTGIAPFRSFWQQRQFDIQHKGINPCPMVLVFGCRQSKIDHIYKEETLQAKNKGVFRELYTAYSREPDKPKKYVQDILQEQLAESVYRALKEQGGHIYVCGDVTMAADVLKAIQRIMTQQGKLSAEDAGVFISRMRDDNRYHEDIFGVTLRTYEVTNRLRSESIAFIEESKKDTDE